MFIGAYHPYDGQLEFCAADEEDFLSTRYLAGVSIGDGTDSCKETLGVALRNGFSPELMKSYTTTCPGHAFELHDAALCAMWVKATFCEGICMDDPEACLNCVQGSCQESFDACYAQSECRE